MPTRRFLASLEMTAGCVVTANLKSKIRNLEFKMPSLRWLLRHGAATAPTNIKLIVGLGNPGAHYARSRHNVGFIVVERFAHAHALRFARKRFNAEIAEGNIGDARVLLAKPQTFMNLSGEAVGKLFAFYKIAPRDLLVVYDDLDLHSANCVCVPRAARADITVWNPSSRASAPPIFRACASASDDPTLTRTLITFLARSRKTNAP
jgi:hypothetical protein